MGKYLQAFEMTTYTSKYRTDNRAGYQGRIRQYVARLIKSRWYRTKKNTYNLHRHHQYNNHEGYYEICAIYVPVQIPEK